MDKLISQLPKCEGVFKSTKGTDVVVVCDVSVESDKIEKRDFTKDKLLSRLLN